MAVFEYFGAAAAMTLLLMADDTVAVLSRGSSSARIDLVGFGAQTAQYVLGAPWGKGHCP